MQKFTILHSFGHYILDLLFNIINYTTIGRLIYNEWEGKYKEIRMKPQKRNQRRMVSVLLTLLLVFGTGFLGYADITTVNERTPQVRDAIVAAVPDVDTAANVTETYLAAITSLNLRGKDISALKTNDFSGLTKLTNLNLFNNQLSSLPDGIFRGLTSLTTIRLGKNAVNPLPFTVSLEKVADGQFKAVAPAGALFNIVLPITVTNGSITGGAITVTIPHGSVESGTLTVTRTTGTTADVTVNIGTLPSLPRNHFGYTLVKSDALPLTIISGTNTTPKVPDNISDDSLTDNNTDNQEIVTQDPPMTNIAPAFLEGENTARIVLENTMEGVNIGKPVLATDADNDFLIYSIGGIDTDAFDIDNNGQLKTKAPLDYETKRVYRMTITVSDKKLSDTISVIIVVIDVNDNVSYMEFVPVVDRTPAARDAIVAAVPNVTDAANVTEAQVATITNLNLRNKGISELKTGDLSGMTALLSLNLYRNNLTRLPPGIFDGLTKLTTLRLGGNVLDPMPLTVFLQRLGMGQYRAMIMTGAPFNIVLPINVSNGSMSGGATSVTIPQGSVTSKTFTVIGTSPKVVIGTFPKLPAQHFGYVLAQSTACGRTQQVTDAIAKTVGVSDCSIVTKVELATITTLTLSDSSITSLSAVDFNGMFSLKTLDLQNNALTSIPDGVLDDLISLRTLFLNGNRLTTLSSDDFNGIPNIQSIFLSNNRLTSLPNSIFRGLTHLNQLDLSGNPNPNSHISLIVALQKVGTSQFKAVVPTGAPFTLTLPITIANGRVTNGVTTITILKGNVESRPLTVTRTANTIAAVTADIGTPLPSLPSTHKGYTFAKSTTLPLEVLPSINLPPVFKEGTNTTRTIAENTTSGANIGDVVAATDKNANDALTYTLSGTNAASFDIDSKTGQIKTKVSLDFERKNTYSITLTVSDGLAVDTIAVTIKVMDIDENRPLAFTEGNAATRTVAENTAADTNIGDTISATGTDGNTLTYSLGGQDASAFKIDTNTGQLKTSTHLDYETKSTYTVSVTVSDAKLTTTIAVTINVTDVNETPVRDAGGQGQEQGQGQSQSQPQGQGQSQPQGQGQSQPQGQGQSQAQGQGQSQGQGQEQSQPQGQEQDASNNNPPVFIAGSNTTRSVSEDILSGIDIGSAVSATDADGDILTYTLSGTDAYVFSIDSTTGQLQTNVFLDYETQSSYIVTITASDGSLTDTISVTINVTDVDESTNNIPVFTDGASTTRSIAENTTSGTNIGSPVSATDANDDLLTYILSGTDVSKFSIDSTTGQLRTKAALDYETKSSYTVTVNVSDGNGGSNSITVTINVTDVTERIPPLYGRTRQVQNAIVAAVSGVNSPENVTAAHLAAITYLGLKRKNIASLKAGDFKGLTSLTGLDLSFNSISNISALKNLTSLTGLDLSANSISDITPLEGLTKLKTLNLWNNSVSDIAALDDLTSLTILYLSYNSISDLSSLKDLTNLILLGLYGNDIEDISVLRKMTVLRSLGLTGNSVSDISPLEDLTSLTWLDLHSNSISDIKPLEDLTNLTYLRLTGNSVNDIKPLDDLTSLTELIIWNNSIEDISPLKNLTSLTKLSLSWNSISDISPLENLTNLKLLSLGENSISDVSSLENLTSLTELYLFENAISDYAPLRRLKTAIGVIDDHPGFTLDITIPTLTNTNIPVFTDGTSTTRSIAENTDADTNIGSPVAATDADTGDTLSYHLGGTDASSFSIVSTSGQLQTSAALDYETKTSYIVKIAVSDGKGGSDTIDVTISVTDVAGAAPSVQTPSVIPDNTVLLSNYPNPFNPETWIPYQLAKPAEVTLTVYNMRGIVVRTIALGHKAAGVYTSRSRAIHWDGKNSIGEKVAAGLYFYTFKAGDLTATRKMLIRK